MSHFGPDEAIARIADWKDKDIRWEELGGGITNHNYIVWVNGGPGNPGGAKYVLRVPGQPTAALQALRLRKPRHRCGGSYGRPGGATVSATAGLLAQESTLGV